MMRSTRRVTAGAGLAGLLLVAGATAGVTAAGAEEAFDGCVPATITVHHVDETGSDLRDPLPVPGVIDGSYYFANESFTGYYFDSVVPKNTGSVSGDLDVTFTYLPIPEGRDGSIDPPPPSTFFACYVDESGTPIAERFEDFGMIGMTWETSALEIPGYRLVSSPEQETGTFTGVTGFVTYVYAPEETTDATDAADATDATDAADATDATDATDAADGADAADAAGVDAADATDATDAIDAADATDATDAADATAADGPEGNADADAGPRPAAPSGPKPQLADTGVADSASVLSAAGVLTLAGAAVLLTRRRQALQG